MRVPRRRLTRLLAPALAAALALTGTVASSVEAVDGIHDVLEQMSIPCCVASSGSHDKMSLTLGRTGLEHYFDNNIFSTSEVENGKPHPGEGASANHVPTQGKRSAPQAVRRPAHWRVDDQWLPVEWAAPSR